VRGAVVLPNGTGKSVRVAVFTQGDNVEKAKAAGADVVGMEDLMKHYLRLCYDCFDVVLNVSTFFPFSGKQ
jgi:large subunit ribosomal protein L1